MWLFHSLFLYLLGMSAEVVPSILIMQVISQWISLYICCFGFLKMCLWDKSLKMELLDQRVNAYVVLLKSAKFSSMGLYYFPFSPARCGECVIKLWICASLIGKKVHQYRISVVLTCIFFFIMSKVEHLCICLCVCVPLIVHVNYYLLLIPP